MKKSMFKRVTCLVLAFVMTFAFLPMTEKEADAAAYTGVVRQTDNPWYDYWYGGGSLAGTGCGLFSLVNCVGYLTGQLMDIPSLASWAYSTGGFNPNADGTYKYVVYPKANIKYGDQYGIYIDCNAANNNEGWWAGAESTLLKTRLQQGEVAIGNVYNHFVAIVDYDPATNKYHVYESAPSSRRGTNYNGGDIWVTQSQFSTGYMDLFWFCFVGLKDKETWQEKAAFDTMVYRDRNPDIAHLSDADLKKHWLEHGIKEGRASSPVLDLGFYYGNNKDLQDAFGKDYEKLYDHFINHGYKEKRKSSALFDGQYYCDNNPEIYAKYGDEYMRHYAETGIKEGRRGSLTFDPDYYWVLKPEVWEAWPAHYELCAKHYAGYGVREGIEAYDNKVPVISDVKISELSPNGYTVTCKVTDNWGIEYVSFPTWTTYNDQDDLAENFLVTQRGTKDGDYYTFRVNASDHNNESGAYQTHIYATDLGGNRVSLAIDAIEVKEDSTNPVISNVTVSNISKEGYTVTCTVTDDWEVVNVAFPTWTTHNSQDDLFADFFNTQVGTKNGNVYTFRVNTADHNNELGEYNTHIYATDNAGNRVCYEIDPITVKDVSDVITLTPSSDYSKDGATLNNVKAETNVDALLNQFENPNLQIVNKNGNEIKGTAFVGTGAKINLYVGGQLVDSITVVIAGDVDGTGTVEGTDYIRVKSAFLGKFAFENAESNAADVDGSETIDATDYINIKSMFLAK